MELPKPKSWSPLAYLFVAVVVSFFTIVAWPLLRKAGENQLAGDDPKNQKQDEKGGKHDPKSGNPKADDKKGGDGPKPRSDEKTPTAEPKKGEAPVVPPKKEPDPPAPRFRDVEIEEPFDAVFAKRKALMDLDGVRELTLPDGRVALVCVVQAKLSADTAAGRLDAGKVCSGKMAARLLEWKKGLDTTRKEELDVATEKIDGTIVTAMKGHVTTLPSVGRWVSAKGDVFYVAFGKVFAAGELKP